MADANCLHTILARARQSKVINDPGEVAASEGVWLRLRVLLRKPNATPSVIPLCTKSEA
jgi:hypothetical protein